MFAESRVMTWMGDLDWTEVSVGIESKEVLLSGNQGN